MMHHRIQRDKKELLTHSRSVRTIKIRLKVTSHHIIPFIIYHLDFIFLCHSIESALPTQMHWINESPRMTKQRSPTSVPHIKKKRNFRKLQCINSSLVYCINSH